MKDDIDDNILVEEPSDIVEIDTANISEGVKKEMRG